MVTYPVNVRGSSYRGADPKKKQKSRDENQLASLIEDAANALIQAQTDAVRSYSWHEISKASGVDVETVARLGYSIDCGANGFTATRPGLSAEDFQRALKGERI